MASRIYHSEIPKSAQCEARESSEPWNETRCSAGRFMEGGREGEKEGLRVFVSQVSRGSRSRGPLD